MKEFEIKLYELLKTLSKAEREQLLKKLSAINLATTINREPEFLNLPCSENKYKKYNNINTNWQYLIARYNDNTGNINDEEVASDLLMPNYLKLEETLCK